MCSTIWPVMTDVVEIPRKSGEQISFIFLGHKRLCVATFTERFNRSELSLSKPWVSEEHNSDWIGLRCARANHVIMPCARDESRVEASSL
ncbi:hypothetical protein OS493_033830 [Desmophyllum pertusum]|uniref:Uncharacterized protein n=1 Tax=Desmophyllum pertusum TaxID=174260 RepID=A0A9W9YVK0_9CNID|nr:hypothetical protein OS493_033830 [Desmophyllum pertusum]